MVEFIPYQIGEVVVSERHTLAIPPCCPVSKNPRPGSSLTIEYQPVGKVLEIASLYAYIHSFVDGLKDESGKVVVRDMEQMIACIALECAQVVGVSVTVYAHLVLMPSQQMDLQVTTG